MGQAEAWKACSQAMQSRRGAHCLSVSPCVCLCICLCVGLVLSSLLLFEASTVHFSASVLYVASRPRAQKGKRKLRRAHAAETLDLHMCSKRKEPQSHRRSLRTWNVEHVHRIGVGGPCCFLVGISRLHRVEEVLFGDGLEFHSSPCDALHHVSRVETTTRRQNLQQTSKRTLGLDQPIVDSLTCLLDLLVRG